MMIFSLVGIALLVALTVYGIATFHLDMEGY